MKKPYDLKKLLFCFSSKENQRTKKHIFGHKHLGLKCKKSQSDNKIKKHANKENIKEYHKENG